MGLITSNFIDFFLCVVIYPQYWKILMQVDKLTINKTKQKKPVTENNVTENLIMAISFNCSEPKMCKPQYISLKYSRRHF